MSAVPRVVSKGEQIVASLNLPCGPVIKDWKQFARSYVAHPLADIFPMMDPESKDFGSLLGSVSVFGVLEPIVLTRDMRVLDGRNRLRAALESVHAEDDEKAPKFVFFDQLPIDHELVSERDYVASKNLSRRHLSDEQKAAAVALLFHGYTEKAAEARKEKLVPAARTRRGEITPTSNKPAERTREKVQKEAGVSEHKARQALKVVEASPELAKQVIAGEVSLKDAAKQVSPPEDKPRATRAPAKKAAASFTGDVFVDAVLSKCLSVINREIAALQGAEQRAACAEYLRGALLQFSAEAA